MSSCDYYRDDVDGLSIISRALAQTANTAFGASAFVFDPNHDPDSDHHRNIEIQKGKMNLKVRNIVIVDLPISAAVAQR